MSIIRECDMLWSATGRELSFMIKRELYMSRIRPFIGTDLIKVMTGIRRCGKSVMLELIHPQELQDKHYFRKHGADAYYGQN